MTIGIYCISFEGLNGVYIGQSVNIESRVNKHNASFSNRTANSKILSALGQYGTPSIDIVEKCLVGELNDRERFWIKEFDAKDNGLNMGTGGSSNGSGTEHPHASTQKIKFTR